MRDFKSILLVCLFSICHFSFLGASELLKVCRIIPPPLEYASNCDPYGGITYFGGEGCNGQVIMKVYLANLTGYNNYPMSSGPFPLPVSVPDLYIDFDSDFDGDYDTKIGPLKNFMWDGIEQTGMDGGTHYVFEQDINLAEYFNIGDPCVSHPSNPIIKTRVLEEEGGVYSLFDVTPFSDFYDVVSCEVFHEACDLCMDESGDPINPDCNSNPPIYEIPLCFDCTTPCEVRDHFNSINNSNELFTTSKATPKNNSQISPNPFQNEINITFNIQKQTLAQIEIINLSGAVIFSEKLTAEIGKRKETIDLEELPNGIYFLKLIANDTSTVTKIVKQ